MSSILFFPVLSFYILPLSPVPHFQSHPLFLTTHLNLISHTPPLSTALFHISCFFFLPLLLFYLFGLMATECVILNDYHGQRETRKQLKVGDIRHAAPSLWKHRPSVGTFSRAYFIPLDLSLSHALLCHVVLSRLCNAVCYHH